MEARKKPWEKRSSSTGIIIQWWALWSSRRKALRTLTTAVPTISCGSPYSRAAKIARNAVISNYTFTSYDINDTDACTAALEEFLYSKMKNDDLYSVTAMSSLMDTFNDQIAMMSMMLGGIAGISF